MQFARPARQRPVIDFARVTTRNFIVATAGHVDHGKSALVKALAGTDPDRLPEEKARGITIDLGFAELSVTNARSEELHVGIVDVPGHEDFVKNMVAGVGSIDLALLVVAADDGWMPQTEEHLQILTYLNVEHAIIVLTKSDLADATRTAANVREQLAATPFENAPIVETSVATGIGIEKLKQVLSYELSSLAASRDLGKPRLFVDRAFSLHGVGTVVTGTLVGGKLARGQNVIVQPRNIYARIRSIQSHNREQQEVEAGMRVALNLPDITVHKETSGVARGDVVTVPAIGEPVNTIDVLLTRSARLTTTSHSLRNGAEIYLHHGAFRVAARVALAYGGNLKSGDTALAQLRLDSPILAFVGDRFVLRDSSERRTLAGGVVLDVAAGRNKFRESRQRDFLAARAKSPNDATIAIQSELRRDGAREQVDLLIKSNFSASDIEAAIEQLVATKEIVMRGDIVADVSFWAELHQRAINAIEAKHKEHPQLTGLDLAELRAQLSSVSPKIFDALIIDLTENGYARIDNYIQNAVHQSGLPPNLADAAKTILHLVSEKPFDPPARKRIAIDEQRRQALKFLIEQGEVIEAGPDLILSREAFAQMEVATRTFISKNGPATVSELRQALQTSRRTIVPFLEHLDQKRITRRTDDRRTLFDEIVTPARTELD
jgi:selenocysteine-specific elongation factor